MKYLLILLMLPLMAIAQTETVDFSKIDSPTLFVGKTDHGMTLNYKEHDGRKLYRMTFPVYLEDKSQGESYMDFYASDDELERLFVFMRKSIGVHDIKVHHEIGDYKIEYLTKTKEVNGMSRPLGSTQVTISTSNVAHKERASVVMGDVYQLGFFNISKSQVGLLFGKQRF